MAKYTRKFRVAGVWDMYKGSEFLGTIIKTAKGWYYHNSFSFYPTLAEAAHSFAYTH